MAEAMPFQAHRRYTSTMNLPLESASEGLLPHAAETETWLLPNGESLDERIERSLAQIERGEGLNEEQLRAFLAERRASRKA